MIFAGKVVLVTGSTTGIGEACARVFAESGATVMVSGRNEERGRAVVQSIQAAGGSAQFAAADLRAALQVNPNDPESVGAAIHRGLNMPLAERKARHRDLLQAVLETDISHWAEQFIARLRVGQVRRAQAFAAE